MKKILALIASFLGLSAQAGSGDSSAFELDYDKMIPLDAETLAEQGILEEYEQLKPELSKYVSQPAEVEEILDQDVPFYKVSSQGETFDIYGPGLEDDEGEAWGRAAYAFFRIVNRQLKDIDIKFYAINGGNELGGMFLTASQYEAAIRSLPTKTDRPYLPKLEHPWYGLPH